MTTKFQKSYTDSTHGHFQKVKQVLLKNSTLVDVVKKSTIHVDVVVQRGKIEHIGKVDSDTFSGMVVDMQERMLIPGMLDMHVHFREPGREDKETLMTGAAAAMAGGFTGVCTMPNTQPATDHREIVDFITDHFKNHLVNVYPIAAITMGRKGEQLVEMAELIEAGVVGFSDDGASVANAQVLRRALEYARMFDVPIIEHCEDASLATGGAMNEGAMSTRLGLPGLPAVAEEIVVARNIMLAEYTDSRMHIAHISTAGAVELVRRAKENGVKVTAEVTPHHFTLSDNALENYDTNLKMSPPLRTAQDVKAIIAGLKDGTIDAIVTDHAPHTEEEKRVEFDTAPFGIIGLETALGLAISELELKEHLSMFEVFEKLTVAPYRVLGLDVPMLQVGAIANMTMVDHDAKWVVDRDQFKSRSRNTPFHGWKLTGRPIGVIHGEYISLSGEK